MVLDEWIVMPNHIHGILFFHSSPTAKTEEKTPSRLLSQSLGAVIGQFKSKATKRIWWDLKHRSFAWQPRFFDTVVRDQADLDRLRAYIRTNPTRWKIDPSRG